MSDKGAVEEETNAHRGKSSSKQQLPHHQQRNKKLAGEKSPTSNTFLNYN